MKIWPGEVGDRFAIAALFIDDTPQVDDIADALQLEIARSPPWNSAQSRPAVEACTNLSHSPGKGGAISIEFVHEYDFGNAVVVSLGPDLLSLGFDTSNAVKDTHGAIQDTQRAQNLESKVCVAGCVDEIYIVRLAGAR